MYYELSMKIEPDMIRYDDSIPKPRFEAYSSIKGGDINNQTIISLFTHIGSHVDAPYHFCENGKPIDEISIDNFIFSKALVVNVKKEKGERIKVEELLWQDGIDEADILMLNTGYSQYHSNESVYRDDFPALSLEVAQYIREKLPKLKAIALDTLSVDGIDGFDTEFVNHHTLLDAREDKMRPVLIYECIDFRSVFDVKGFFKVYGIPLRLTGVDASPVNMVAEIN